MFQGATVRAYSGLRGIVPALGMFAGGLAGYKMSDSPKGWGALTGAIAGGLLGLIFR